MGISGIINYIDPENNFVANMNWLDKKTKETSTGILSSTSQFFVTRLDSALVAAPIEFFTIAENALLSVARFFGAGAQILVKGVRYVAPFEILDSLHDKLPNGSEFIATLVKTVKYAFGTLSTATVGILLPSYNLKVHSYLGLAQQAQVNPQGSTDDSAATTLQGSLPGAITIPASDDANANNINKDLGIAGNADPLSKPPVTAAPETPVAPTTPSKASPGATLIYRGQTYVLAEDQSGSGLVGALKLDGKYYVLAQQQPQQSPSPQRSPQQFNGFNPVAGAYSSMNSANNAMYSQQGYKPYNSAIYSSSAARVVSTATTTEKK